MRRIIYGISFWASIAAIALTIAAIALPNWVTYTSPTADSPIRVTYGLHKRCSSITGKCTKFPLYEDCLGEDRYFCSMWRSTGFLMNFAVVLELAVVIAYVTILAGGRTSREAGWKILAELLGLVAAAELIAMALVVRSQFDRCAAVGRPKRDADMATGVPLRPRQPLFRRLGAWRGLDSLHCQLGCPCDRCSCHCVRQALITPRRRLRAYIESIRCLGAARVYRLAILVPIQDRFQKSQNREQAGCRLWNGLFDMKSIYMAPGSLVMREALLTVDTSATFRSGIIYILFSLAFSPCFASLKQTAVVRTSLALQRKTNFTRLFSV